MRFELFWVLDIVHTESKFPAWVFFGTTERLFNPEKTLVDIIERRIRTYLAPVGFLVTMKWVLVDS